MADTPLSGTRLCIAPRHVTSFTCRAVPPRCPALRDLHLSSLYERSLLLVCPHAAAQVLFFRGKFHFEMNSVPAGSLRPANQDVPTLDEPLPELSYILDLQRTCLRILETQKYTIDVRLILLGLYLEDAVDFISDGHGYDLGKIIKSYESPLFAARFDAALRNVKFDPPAQRQVRPAQAPRLPLGHRADARERARRSARPRGLRADGQRVPPRRTRARPRADCARLARLPPQPRRLCAPAA